MKRRAFQSMLGLAPVAAACGATLPAMALPKPVNPKEIVGANIGTISAGIIRPKDSSLMIDLANCTLALQTARLAV